jgi:hypothetical protein
LADEVTAVVTQAVSPRRYPTARTAEWYATCVAKDLAERSRGAVDELRACRYGLELALGETMRGGDTAALETILTDIVELSTACGRATEESRWAAKAGLWSWLTDDNAYHAQRRLIDPGLPPRPGLWRGRRRPWFGVLDAGVRQCLDIERWVSAEVPLLHSLLNAASTIAVTREARAQEKFNLIAAVGGTLFGLPALILALYGADSVLPITTANLIVLIPLATAGLCAAILAALLPGRERRGRGKRFVYAISAVILVLLLLGVAGGLADPPTGR